MKRTNEKKTMDEMLKNVSVERITISVSLSVNDRNMLNEIATYIETSSAALLAQWIKENCKKEFRAKQGLELDFDKLPEPKCSHALPEEVKIINSPIRQFWSEVSPEIKNWNLLPFTFLYDLYKAWYRRFVPSGNLTGKTTFVNELIKIIKDDEVWFCDDKTKQINVNKFNMLGPEYLIAEYGLTDWMSKTYKGDDWKKQCVPVLKQKYTGLLRRGFC